MIVLFDGKAGKRLMATDCGAEDGSIGEE